MQALPPPPARRGVRPPARHAAPARNAAPSSRAPTRRAPEPRSVPASRTRRRPPPVRRRRIGLLVVLAAAAAGAVVASHHGDPASAEAGARGLGTTPAVVSAAVHVSHEAQHAAIARLIASGRPVYCGGGTKPLVALTFDDGPGPYTRHTLQVLRTHHAKGTFFLVAREVLGWPDLKDVPAKEAAQGAVGDHTYDHSSLPGATADQLTHQIGDAKTVIEAAAGGRTVRLFRPPFGAHDAASDAEVHDLGMLEVLWSVDTADSRGATADQIRATVERDVRPGSIVLLHENRGTTRRALPDILATLARKGLQAVTVPELLALDPPSHRQLRSGSCG